MEVIIRPTTESAVNLTARLMADAIRANPKLVLGLATGRTMEAVYAELARLNREKYVSFADVVTFNLDEYIGIPASDKNSYRAYMDRNLFDKIDIKKENTHLENGMAPDPENEGPRYEKLIAEAGGIDLQLLGIGRDGHIGFNEPLSSLSSRTRAKSLTPETYAQNSPLFDKPEDMPMRAFTMGVGTIMDAKRIIMLVTGAEKAKILAAAVEGPVTSMVSGSMIQMHSNVVVIVDEEAGAYLQSRAYCDFIFKNEPKWAPYR